jgi:hypothetical protein
LAGLSHFCSSGLHIRSADMSDAQIPQNASASAANSAQTATISASAAPASNAPVLSKKQQADLKKAANQAEKRKEERKSSTPDQRQEDKRLRRQSTLKSSILRKMDQSALECGTEMLLICTSDKSQQKPKVHHSGNGLLARWFFSKEVQASFVKAMMPTIDSSGVKTFPHLPPAEPPAKLTVQQLRSKMSVLLKQVAMTGFVSF